MKKILFGIAALISSLSAQESQSLFNEEVSIRYSHEELEHGKMKGKDLHQGDSHRYEGIFQASFIYWIAQEDGMASFRTLTPTGFQDPSVIQKGDIIYPDFFLRPGFKVSAGARFVEPRLTLMGNYVWFNNKYNNWRTYDWVQDATFATYSIWMEHRTNKGAIRWRNRFQTIDVMASGEMDLSSRMVLSPFFGLLGGWDHQWLDVFAHNTNEAGGAYTKLEQTWWAIGPFAGMKATIDMYSNKEMGAKIFGSARVGETWSVSTPVFRSLNTRTPQQIGAWYTSRIHRIQPMLQTELGIHLLGRPMTSSPLTLYTNVTWEQQAWLHHNYMFPDVATTVTSSIFTIGGLTWDVGVSF